jgi:hypothetical protein
MGTIIFKHVQQTKGIANGCGMYFTYIFIHHLAIGILENKQEYIQTLQGNVFLGILSLQNVHAGTIQKRFTYTADIITSRS